jgi:SP family xylose:H+ symportor-like MFS transporter
MSKKGLLILITSVAALGGLLFGYDTGIINGTQFYFSKYFELDPFMKGWVVSSALIGCLFGAIAAGFVSNLLGRKVTLIISTAISVFISGI